jgi:leucyl aminopeptidase
LSFREGFLMRLLAAILLATVMLARADAARPIEFASVAPGSGAIVLPLGSEGELASRGSALDAASREAVGRALASARFDYKAGSTLSLRGIGPWSQILIIGTKGEEAEALRLQNLGGTAARETAREDGPVALMAEGVGTGPDAAAQIALGARLGAYRFDRYRSENADRPRRPGMDAPLRIVTASAPEARTRWEAEGEALSEGVYFTRDLITEPANIIYPESFVARTREAFQGIRGVTIEVLDEREMERLGMGAILSVGRGSARPPRMLIVHYRGQGANERPIVLAGKGITFDSGGISLKPGSGMWRMKTDMSGAAAVMGTTLSLARRGAPVNVVAIAALAENMPSGSAARPGDVVRAYNGKTIEIHSTDAEGRMVLADAVSYAERRFNPAAIVDVATLTGSVVGALGADFAGLFSRHDTLADQLSSAGEATGERLWRLPLIPRYAEAVESPIADIRDIGEGAPGAGVGAHFIGFFVTPTTPWAHLDIAGTAWSTSATPTVPAGAVGMAVRLLDRFVRDFRPIAAADAAAPGN